MRELFPFQERGVDFLVNGGVLIADAPGLGKTIQLIRAYKIVNPVGVGVVACPANVQGVWERELKEEGLVPFLLTSQTLKKLDAAIGTFDLIVVSIDLPGRTPKIANAIRSLDPSILIVDECHFLKSADAQRTQFFLTGHKSVADMVDRVWLASGTPAPNHAGELWSLIAATEPDRIGSMDRDEFERTYCRWKRVKRKGQREFQQVIAGTNMITMLGLRKSLGASKERGAWWLRRKKEEVLTELPAKLRQVVPMLVKDLRLLDELEETEEGLALRDGLLAGDLAIAETNEDGDAPEHHMARIRRLMALMKAEAAAEYVNGLLEQHPKMIVWGWHTAALKRVAELIKAPTFVLDGSSPKRVRDAAVERFQTAPGPLVACMQIRAMGTGVTMTAADRAVFFEASFTPGDNAQAEDRIHRIGQDRGCLIDYLCIRGSIDVAVMNLIARKTAEWEKLEQSALEK